MRNDIVTGATFPDYELPDQTGRRRKLSGIQDHDPMIVVLSRGHYCPKDSTASAATVVARCVSPQAISSTLSI